MARRPRGEPRFHWLDPRAPGPKGPMTAICSEEFSDGITYEDLKEICELDMEEFDELSHSDQETIRSSACGI